MTKSFQRRLRGWILPKLSDEKIWYESTIIFAINGSADEKNT